MERVIIEIFGFYLVFNIQDKNCLIIEKGFNGIIVFCIVIDFFFIEYEGGGYCVIVDVEVGQREYIDFLCGGCEYFGTCVVSFFDVCCYFGENYVVQLKLVV